MHDQGERNKESVPFSSSSLVSQSTKKTTPVALRLRQRNGIKAPDRFEAFDFIRNVKHQPRRPPNHRLAEEEKVELIGKETIIKHEVSELSQKVKIN